MAQSVGLLYPHLIPRRSGYCFGVFVYEMSERHDDFREEYEARSHWSLSSHAMSRSPHRVSLSWTALGRLKLASIEANDEVSEEAKGKKI